MDFDGSYYRLTISVGKNGVINTVYNVGKIKKVGQTDVKSLKIKASRSHSNFDTIISHSSQKSNTNSENPEERNSLRDTAYLEAVNNGDMETAQRMVDEVAKEKRIIILLKMDLIIVQHTLWILMVHIIV